MGYVREICPTLSVAYQKPLLKDERHMTKWKYLRPWLKRFKQNGAADEFDGLTWSELWQR